MTLEDYLKEKYPNMRISAAEAAFAVKIGSTRQSVARYRLFQHFPTPKMIACIRKETGGLVDANDHMPPNLRPSKSKTKSRA